MKLAAEFYTPDGMKNIYGFEGEPEDLLDFIGNNNPTVTKVVIYLDEPLIEWSIKG